MLAEIRQRLEVAMAATAVTSAALKSQHADSDEDASLVLQRCVADEIDRQIESIDWVIARCRALGRKPAADGGAS